MNYQFNQKIGRVFESADLLSDDFENYGFDEHGLEEQSERVWNEENYITAAIKELDDSLGMIDLHQ